MQLVKISYGAFDSFYCAECGLALEGLDEIEAAELDVAFDPDDEDRVGLLLPSRNMSPENIVRQLECDQISGIVREFFSVMAGNWSLQTASPSHLSRSYGIPITPVRVYNQRPITLSASSQWWLRPREEEHYPERLERLGVTSRHGFLGLLSHVQEQAARSVRRC